MVIAVNCKRTSVYLEIGLNSKSYAMPIYLTYCKKFGSQTEFSSSMEDILLSGKWLLYINHILWRYSIKASNTPHWRCLHNIAVIRQRHFKRNTPVVLDEFTDDAESTKCLADSSSPHNASVLGPIFVSPVQIAILGQNKISRGLFDF